MDNGYIWFIAAVALLIGGVFAGLYSDDSAEVTALNSKVTTLTNDLANEKAKPAKVINQTITITVPSADAILKQAQIDAWNELVDDDDFLTVNGTEYDEDEVTISRVTNWSYHWIDKDEYKVVYTAKYKFDSSDNDDRETVTRTVTVFYEDGEEPEVSWD